MLQNRLFLALALRSGFGAPIYDVVARSCVLQFSLCRSHCNGCVKVAWRRACVPFSANLLGMLSRVQNRNVLWPFNGELACCDIPGAVI